MNIYAFLHSSIATEPPNPRESLGRIEGPHQTRAHSITVFERMPASCVGSIAPVERTVGVKEARGFSAEYYTQAA
jgi:hypothetical protein